MGGRTDPDHHQPAGETWIWSDLHFADRSVVEACDRPFADVDRKNHHLIREWRWRVRADDTIFCLGDVGLFGVNYFCRWASTISAG